MVVLILLLVLVTIPLYLCRRPVAIPDDVANTTDLDASSTTVEINGQPANVLSNAPSVSDSGVSVPVGLTLSEAHVLECHDPGSIKTAPKDCDRLPTLERAFAQAIADNASCVPAGVGGGTVLYDIDVSYQRKKQPVMLSLPHEGRTLSSNKAINTCASGVKKSLSSLTPTDATHAHSRYKIEIVATYSPR